MWHVYRSEDNVKSDDFYFAESKPLSALRYAFILRKRTGAIIPKAIYNKLMAEVKAMRPQAESAPAQQESQPTAEVGEAPAAEAEQSPIARQYSEMKAKHTDAILLFRVGSFYESFGDDAVAVSDILDLTLTRRSGVKDITERRAAFPAHSINTYLPKLVRAGKRVAICDGLPEPQPKKAARRRSTKQENNK